MEKQMKDSRKHSKTDHTKIVINLSNKSLSEDPIFPLKKDPKFVISAKTIPKIDLEDWTLGIKKLEKAGERRWKIRTILDSATKRPEPYFTRAEQISLKDMELNPFMKIFISC